MKERLYGFTIISPIAMIQHQYDQNALWFNTEHEQKTAGMMANISAQSFACGATKTMDGETLTIPCPTIKYEGYGETDEMQKGTFYEMPCVKGPVSLAQKITTRFQEDLLHTDKVVHEADGAKEPSLASEEMANRVSHFQSLEKFFQQFPAAAERVDLTNEATGNALAHMFGDNGYMLKEEFSGTWGIRDAALKEIATHVGPDYLTELEAFRANVTYNVECEDVSVSHEEAELRAVSQELDRMEEVMTQSEHRDIFSSIRQDLDSRVATLGNDPDLSWDAGPGSDAGDR